MTTQICTECSHEYDDETVNIPTPIEDRMCFKCGSILSDDEIAALVQKLQTQAAQEAGGE